MATKLKVELVKHDLTQGDLARIIGINEGSMSALVRGKSEPSIRVALKIARALDTTVEELWGHLIEENENQPD